jgi:hypothetical protein
MGYVPPPALPPALNIDSHGMPKDFATYMWLLYKRRVVDESPARLAFIHGPRSDVMDLASIFFAQARLTLDS